MNASPPSADLAGARYLILGGSGGVGSALARRLAARGATLTLAARTAAPLAALAAELGATAAPLDATDMAAVLAAARDAAARDGGLDGVICAVGSILLKPAHRTRPEELRAVLEQNVVTAFNAVAAAGEVISGPGAVVLFASVAARVGLVNHEAIAAAKAAVIGLTQAAAATYAGRRLRINAVAPGLTDTPLAAGLTSNPVVAKASAAMHPLGRIGRADEVARAAEFLLDPASDWITGQVLSVDGGLGAARVR
jgi:NAD(P)-dependent dehydrogenase (short-subunit alcohol dehydrogenase family)